MQARVCRAVDSTDIVKIGFTALKSFRRQSPDFVFQGPVGRRQFDGEVQLLGVQRAYLDRYFFIGDCDFGFAEARHGFYHVGFVES